MMKRLFSLLVAVVVGSNVLFAQTLEQGRKFFYYERYKSAKDAFEKVLAANPNNIDAVYWLGQTLLEQKDSVGAKNLYRKYLEQNGNAPLLLAGMGQIELMEGKTNDARQRFETAINLTKGKDVDLLNAVGRANVEARAGDANYAVEKLNLATQVKNFKTPDTYLLLGDAYRKLIDGGNAVISYNKAFALDSKLAAAKYSIGRVYLTQGNKEFFLPAFEEAVTIDPAYTPAYYELFYYWYFRDVNKAAPYLDKYIANADQGPESESLKTDFLYASGKFAEAKDKALALINQNQNQVVPARLYKLVAYACDTLGDLTCAKSYITQYFAKQSPELVVSADYEELANINAKTPGSEAEAFTNLQKAVETDTLVENKVKYINKAAALAKKMGNRSQEANWLGIAYSIKPNPTQTDLYNWGMAHYQSGNYVTADSIFCNVYVSKYPNQIYGYLWCAKSKLAQDTTMEKGLAVEPYKKLIVFADTAREKYKSTLLQAHSFLAAYYANVAKNKDSAIAQLQGILELDPGNADATKYIEVLKKPAQKAPAPKSGGSKPASTATKPPAKKEDSKK